MGRLSKKPHKTPHYPTFLYFRDMGINVKESTLFLIVNSRQKSITYNYSNKSAVKTKTNKLIENNGL